MMRVAVVASECVPFASTGGLGEVVGALPRYMARLGHQVTVYLPFYGTVRQQLGRDDKTVISSITIPFSHYNRFLRVMDGGRREDVQYYFIDCPELFDREGLYANQGGDYQDNWERFGLFCRGVLEASKQLGVPEVFHVHDWQAALLPVYLRTLYAVDPVLRSSGAVLTVHNAGYQGWFPPETIARLLFPWDIYTPNGVEHYGTFNFLKGGLVYSDMITTVSRRYAEEIQTPEYGASLDGVFRWRAQEMRGILNGVDDTHWDPARDGNLAAHYTRENLAGKADCRADLLHAFGLQELPATTAVIGIVSRLANQKGFDLLMQAADALAERDLAIVILGTGEPHYERLVREWAVRRQERVRAQIRYDDALAHKVTAGSDMILMPSRYEPCGMNQIYALRYGTVPIVRATGGLEDTVQEWNAESATGTGFKFQDYSAESMLQAVDRALDAFRDREAWQTMMRNGMAQDFGWDKPAWAYAAVYEDVAHRRG